MSLMTDAMAKCTMLDKKTVPDGQGGFIPTWTDGAEFQAAITKDSTAQMLIAEAQGVTEVYTVWVDKGLGLDFHDVFRRDSDGAIFRVTSNQQDNETPKRATFNVGHVSAERWVLPT